MRPLAATRYANGFRRTIDHLKSWRIVVPETVTNAEISLSSSGGQCSGARIFVCENIPQLKYHNPKLKVDVKLKKGTASPAMIKFNTGCGQELTSLEITGLSSKEIKALVDNIDWTQPPV